MSLRELNLNKVIGREAMLQSRWSVITADGQTREVWAGLKSAWMGTRVIVKADDVPVIDERKMVVAGQLAQFELGGDIFALRHSGMGLLGKLGLVQNGREAVALTAAAQSVPSSGEAAAPVQEVVWDTWIEEAERYSEPLGDEVRIIDNTRSNSSTERKITVSRQWSQTVALDMEKATEFGGSVDLKLPWSIGFNASAKQSVTRKYAISEGASRTYSEEVKINVLPHTRTTVTFHWRQVWQKGVVVGRDGEGHEIRAPFEVKLHPTFDQAQEDVKSEKPSTDP